MLLASGSITTPYWLLPALGLGGIVAGALLTQWFTVRNENRRYERAQKDQAARDAREVEVRLLSEVNRMCNRVISGTPWRELDDEGMYLAWAELPLVASTPVVRAGTWMTQRCMDFGVTHRKGKYDESHRQMLAIFYDARRRYIDAIRAEAELPPTDEDATTPRDPDQP